LKLEPTGSDQESSAGARTRPEQDCPFFLCDRSWFCPKFSAEFRWKSRHSSTPHESCCWFSRPTQTRVCDSGHTAVFGGSWAGPATWISCWRKADIHCGI